MKKILSIILTLTATAALLSGCGGSKQAKAIVGSQDIIEGSIVSKAGGYFKQEMGPETEVKMFDAGRDINAALMSGSIDFGNFGVVPTTVGLSSGNDFKVIWIACLIRQSECLIVREGKRYRDSG